jgi:hypothetical protein
VSARRQRELIARVVMAVGRRRVRKKRMIENRQVAPGGWNGLSRRIVASMVARCDARRHCPRMTRTRTCLSLSYFRSRPPFMHSIAPSPHRRLTEFPSQSCPRPPPVAAVVRARLYDCLPSAQMPIVKLENHALALAEQQARERDADTVSDDSVSVDSAASSCSSSSPALSPYSAIQQVGVACDRAPRRYSRVR